jgi:hypothetical protein
LATICIGNTREEWADDDPRVMADHALGAAADRIGLLSGASQMREHLRRGRVRRTFRFTPPQALITLVEARPMVLSGQITPAEAMGLLWGYDVMKERGLRP